MKTRLTLSAVLLSLTLAPAAFANGAQDQAPARPASGTHGTVTVLDVVTTAPDLAAVTRSALKGLDAELRATLLGSLRESTERMLLQFAAPLIEERAATLTGSLAISAR